MPNKLTEQQRENQKKYLLNTGRELMIQYGISKTTVDDIVNAAKIAKGTFYLYFKSKEDFFSQLLTQINYSFFLLAEEIIRGKSSAGLQGRLRHFFEDIFNKPELAFYFREHKEVCELTEKFSEQNFTDIETSWIKNLLLLGNIDIQKVIPEIVHNYIHIIYLAKNSDLIIENYRTNTINSLITALINYIFTDKDKS